MVLYDHDEAKRLMLECYQRFQKGYTKDDVVQFRDQEAEKYREANAPRTLHSEIAALQEQVASRESDAEAVRDSIRRLREELKTKDVQIQQLQQQLEKHHALDRVPHDPSHMHQSDLVSAQADIDSNVSSGPDQFFQWLTEAGLDCNEDIAALEKKN
mmetsp:Transcript_124814/g.226535  ORF Transcript_124814/g.226535 Transcript_124814/m.226535 type:complete len:157 (-) Transcript_124814:1520-1990(-)